MITTTGPVAIVPLFLLEDQTVCHGAIRLWGILYAKWADQEGHHTPSRSELAAQLDQSTDTIDRWIKQLRDAGVLNIIPQATPQHRRVPNRYELNIVRPSRTHAAPPSAPKPLTPEELIKVNREELAVSKGISAEVQARERVLQSTNSIKRTKGYPRWDQFWARYPRRHRKAAAHKVWIKLGAESNEELYLAIMVGLRKHIAVWTTENRERRFIPYPRTWLNDEGWLDEVDADVPMPVLSKQTRTIVSSTERFLARHNGGSK